MEFVVANRLAISLTHVKNNENENKIPMRSRNETLVD